MNCADCIEGMLEADVAELRGEGSGELADHLRSCIPCRRLAEAIVADTRMLARATGRTARPRARRRGAAIAGLAAAAVILAVGTKAIMSHDARSADRLPVAPTVPPVAESRPAGPSTATASVTRQPAPMPAESRTRAAPRRIRAVPIQATALVAVPIRTADPAMLAAQPPLVSVSPHGGRRAAVFRVAESNVTVVWLY